MASSLVRLNGQMCVPFLYFGAYYSYKHIKQDVNVNISSLCISFVINAFYLSFLDTPSLNDVKYQYM